MLEKILIFVSIIIFSFLLSTILIVSILERKCLWANGKNKVLAFYGDIFEINKTKDKKIIVIPVNDTFETIIDENLTQNNPLVSLKTIHGQWLKYMNELGYDYIALNKLIETDLKNRNINPIREYSKKDKPRGNTKSYPLGSIITISGKNDTTFYLIAISCFDKNNRATTSRKNIRNCVDDLLEFYDKNGQEYPIYIPLFGTGRSRADLNHQQAFKIIKSILTDEQHLHGTINIVVFTEDKDRYHF